MFFIFNYNLITYTVSFFNSISLLLYFSISLVLNSFLHKCITGEGFCHFFACNLNIFSSVTTVVIDCLKENKTIILSTEIISNNIM